MNTDKAKMETIILEGPNFAIIPQGRDAIWESDAEFYATEEDAYDAAYDWSAELGGKTINVCRINHRGTWDVITQVWS